jgi:hypothetical protein
MLPPVDKGITGTRLRKKLYHGMLHREFVEVIIQDTCKDHKLDFMGRKDFKGV